MKKKKWKQYLAAGLAAIMIAEMGPVSVFGLHLETFAEPDAGAGTPPEASDDIDESEEGSNGIEEENQEETKKSDDGIKEPGDEDTKNEIEDENFPDYEYDSDFGKLITNVQILHLDSLEEVTEEDPIMLGEEAVFRFTYELTDEMQEAIADGEDLELEYQLPDDVLLLTESYDDLVGEEFYTDGMDTIAYRGEYREDGELGIWIYSEEEERFDEEYTIDVPFMVDSEIALYTEEISFELWQGYAIEISLYVILEVNRISLLNVDELTYAVPETNAVLTYIVTENDDITIIDCNDDVTGEINIPSQIDGYSVTSIADHAFDYCGFSKVVLPMSVISIGEYSFYDCDYLTSVSLEKSNVTKISSNAFAGDGNLIEILLPARLEEIGESTFWWCENLTSISIPSYIKVIGDNAFVGCLKLSDVYYGGSTEDWEEINIGTGNGYLVSATMHYNCGISEESSSFICYLTNYEILNSILYLNGQLSFSITEKTDTSFLGQIENWLGKYVYVTKTVNIDVDSESAPDILISIEVVEAKLGNVTSVDDDSIEIDGIVFPYFRNVYNGLNVIYWEKNNTILDFEILFHGKGRLETWSKDDRTITIYKGIGSGNKTFILSPLVGNEIFDKLIDLKLEDITFKYDSNNFIYSISKVPDSMYFVPIEEKTEQKLLQEYVDKWYEAYEKFIEAMQKELDKFSGTETATRDSIIDAKAKEMRKEDGESGSKYINFTSDSDFPDSWKDAAYKALATLLYDHACSNVNFDNIDVSNIFAGSTLVQTIMKSMANTTEKYDYNDIIVNLHVFQFGTAKFGELTCYKKGSTVNAKTAVICSTQSECASTIQDYYEQLKKLENKSLFNIYTAISKDILGKSISSYTEEFLKKKVEKYAAELKKTGIGDLAKNLNTCYNYYNHINKLSSLSVDKIEDIIPMLNNLEFNDTTIESKIVKKAMKKLNKARDELNNACAEYVAGTLKENSIKAWFKTVIGCPVNVTVFDSDGNEIGYSGIDDIWYSDNIYIDETGDAIIVHSLTDDVLTFDIVGEDYGTMGCSIEEYDENGDPTGRINFFNISLEPDQILSFSLTDDLFTNNEIVKIITNNRTIYADESIFVDEDAGVCISCDINSNGKVFGTGTYVRGNIVTMLAVPENGYRFIGWYSNNNLISVSATYEFIAEEDAMLTAEFAEENDTSNANYILTIENTIGGSSTGEGKYEGGELATIIASPEQGYHFEGWYINNTLVSNDSIFKFLVNENMTIVAKFENNASSGGGSSSDEGSSSGNGDSSAGNESSTGENSGNNGSSSGGSSSNGSSSGSSSGHGGSSGGGSGSGGFIGGDSSSANGPAGGPASLPSYVVTGTWTMTADGNWTFTDSNGVVYKNMWAAVYNPYANTAIGQSSYDWFYFDANGFMVTGWITDNNRRYYLNPVSDGTRGRMFTGWKQIDGKWYYFNEISDGTKGAMITDAWIDEKYYVNKEGIWEEGKTR